MIWDPFSELERMRDRIDRMMDEWGGRRFEFLAPEVRVRIPPMDIKKKGGNLVIEMDMPGLSKEDINLRLTENRLSVFAEKKKVKEEEKEGFYRSERMKKSYSRSTTLPVKVDPDKVKANYENGTLRIEAPIAEKEKKKGIKVKVK